MKDEFILALAKKVIPLLVSGKVYKEIEKLVDMYMNQSIPGAEKKAKVKEAVMPYLSLLGKFFISTVISFAVDSLRKQINYQEVQHG